jgi:hypothetical protein
MTKEEKKERDRRIQQVIKPYDLKDRSDVATAFRLGWNLSHRYSRDKKQ